MTKSNRLHHRFLPVITLVVVLVGTMNTGNTSPVRASASFIRIPQDTTNLQAAISLIADGGKIEISSGVYYAPTGGFTIDNLPKSFSIEAAQDAEVSLDGNHATDILRYANVTPIDNYSVLFKGITFRNGKSTTAGIGGGVTIKRARATFIDCKLIDNFANSTSGGGLYLEDRTSAYFYHVIWQNNISPVGGGGLGMRTGVNAFIIDSQFIDNRVNPPSHSDISSGGAIYIANSKVRIAGTYFSGNQSGAHGGAIYGIGTWQSPFTTPQTDILITNSTFINNAALRAPSVQAGFPIEGGAINVEDQTILKVYNSRFITNSAQIGGGVNGFRAQIEIYKSVFKGNTAFDPSNMGGFGGSVSLTSSDGASDGTDNKPAGRLRIEDSYFLGRYGSVTTVAHSAGCIHARGDTTRIENNDGIPNVGTLDENRSVVELRRIVLNDCDIDLTQYGGGATFALVNITIEDSLVINCDSLGNKYAGAGGIAILMNSVGSISNTVFAKNTTVTFGGAIFTQGSAIHIHDSAFFQNAVNPAVLPPYAESYGAAIFTSGDWSRLIDGNDLVQNNVFSSNVGIPIFDDDRDAAGMPINNAIYNGNSFYESTYGTNEVYRSALSDYRTPSQLNNLTIYRSAQNRNTIKSTLKNNLGLGAVPNIAKILAVSPTLLQKLSAAETEQPEEYIAYAWLGSQAALDGSSLPTNTGISAYISPGTHILSQNGVNYSAVHVRAPLPVVQLFASGSGSVTLAWSTISGNYLQGMIDHGASGSVLSGGSIAISTANGTNYGFFAVMEEGGVVDTAVAGPAVLVSTPNQISLLLGLNSQINKGVIQITNQGLGSIQWSAAVDPSGLIGIVQASGWFEETDLIQYFIDTDSRVDGGVYSGWIAIDGGLAGLQQVAFSVKFLSSLDYFYIPFASR